MKVLLESLLGIPYLVWYVSLTLQEKFYLVILYMFSNRIRLWEYF